MLVFVIPLKSAKASRSWDQACKLFERCLRSVCHQTHPAFKAIVVCNEQPDIAFQHPNVHYLNVDFTLPDQDSVAAMQFLNLKRTDKGRKALAGLLAAQDYQPTHTMLVDADDCVSNQLADFVQRHPQANGWYMAKGYRYEEGSARIYLKRNNFYRMCGTCNILRYDLNQLPATPEYNRGYGYYQYYIDHAKVRQVLAERHTPLAALPFAGAVYTTGTGENIFFDRNRLYQGVLTALNYRALTPAIRQEFSLYSIS